MRPLNYPTLTLVYWLLSLLLVGLSPVLLAAADDLPGPITTPTAAAPSAPSTVTPTDTPTPPSSAVENSVVKIFSTVRNPNPYEPWTKASPSEISGSGVIIEGKRILTNSHVVLYASQIQVQANQSGDKISATVEAVAPGIDLAVLKLDDERLFDTHPPLPRASSLPQIKDPVLAYGYPNGGDSLSITKGIVSRIEFTFYNHDVKGLRVQIDAAINPGNSGGPAVANDKMIGLAFSHLGGSENIGYIIPCEEIELFLKDIADGHYDGKPTLFEEWQTNENPVLRPYLKLNDTQTGVIINRPYDSSPSYPLKKWDFVTKIGDEPIDDQGMIHIGNDLRVRFEYMVQKIAKNGVVPLTIIRDGKEMQVQVPVCTSRDLVIPYLNGAYPSYFIYGPLVFSNATREFLKGYLQGENAISYTSLQLFRGNVLFNRIDDKPNFDGERMVVVSSPLFPHKTSKGYSNPMSQVVKSINGIPIKNLAHLVQVLRDCKDEFITIDFDIHEGEQPVFRRSEMLTATQEILTDNNILAQGSPDVMPIWNAKPTP